MASGRTRVAATRCARWRRCRRALVRGEFALAEPVEEHEGLRARGGLRERGAKPIMSRRKKRPLPPRTLRMDRPARLQSARRWLATQRGRPAERIARSYRSRYGMDWPCAIAELSALGIAFDANWREQLARTLEGARQAKSRRRAEQPAAAKRAAWPESDETFACIAGYTTGGAPFGVTWEEGKRIERNATIEPPPPTKGAVPRGDDESVPF